MRDSCFGDEDLQMRDVAREFAQKEIRPAGRQLDKSYDAELFWDLWKKAAKLGLLGVMVPEHYGGVGGSPVALTLIIEELAAADAGFAVCLSMNWFAQCMLITVGSSAQMEAFLPMISSSDALPAAACATEPQGGSDVESVRRCGPGCISTTYRKKDGGFVINGTKNFITNGGLAGLYLVLATADVNVGGAAASTFIVPGDAPGISVGGIEDKMGIRSSQTAQMIFDDVFVPEENLLGEEWLGLEYVELAMIFSRGAVGGIAVGIAWAAFEEALAYARERVQGGRPIIEHQGIGFMLADMAIMVEAGRNMVHRSALASLDFDIEADERFRLSCMAKVFCSDMAMKVTTDAVQILGGYGYTRDYPVEKYMRDVKVTQIFEGPNQVQRVDILERL
jgi:alkylation response protein AidB-like acyl-CoA dehydrogenase